MSDLGQLVVTLGVAAIMVLLLTPLIFTLFLDLIGISDARWDVVYMWWDSTARALLHGIADLKMPPPLAEPREGWNVFQFTGTRKKPMQPKPTTRTRQSALRVTRFLNLLSTSTALSPTSSCLLLLILLILSRPLDCHYQEAYMSQHLLVE